MGNRLLLADDSITIQKVVAIIFANEEFELTVVDNGSAALEKAREIRPDVMLVDALMPGKNGYEVCTEIRRDPVLQSVPILLLIGAFEPLDEEKARDCGADATISKPFESQQLIDRVKELLELGKQRAAAPPVAAAPSAAAPAARPLPLEAAAEELWGDLSSFDTMPPVQSPAALAAPEPIAPPDTDAFAAFATFAAASAAPAAPTAPTAAAPQAAPAYAAPAAPAAPPAPQPAAVVEEIVEAGFEDDLWGAFDLEEAPAAPGAAPEAFGVLEPDSEFEAEEFFSFEEESEVVETGPALDLAYAVDEPVVQPSAEEMFSFEEVPVAPAAEPEPAPFELPEPEPAPFELPELEPFALEPEVVELAAAEPFAEPFAEPIPAIEPQGTPVHEGVTGAAQFAAQQPAAAAGLSEEQLAAAISRISREVIERIVWEVVPDLAEMLIKEEIKKLRAGSHG